MPYYYGYRHSKRSGGHGYGDSSKYKHRSSSSRSSGVHYRSHASRRYSRPKYGVSTTYPDSKYCKLVYHDFYTLSSGGAATYAYKAWCGNDPRDPDPSVGGSSPSGYTNMCRLFNYYDVKAAKFEVNIFNGGSAQNIDVGLVAIPTQDFGAFTSSNSALANITAEILVPCHRGKVTELAGISNNNFPAALNKRYLGLYAKTRTVIRLPHDSNEVAAVGGDPTSIWYFVLWVSSSNQTSFTNTLTAQVTITYYTKFLQRSVTNYDA